MNIVVKDLQKSFGKKPVLKNVNLSIGGGMFGLLGPNGAGKTTLMRIMSTLLEPTSGEVNVGEYRLNQKSQIRSILGYLPQEFSFYPQLSVYETLDYLAILSGINQTTRRKKLIREMLEKVNLWEYKKVKTRNLSGGMKRRLGIAQALLNDPKILIVDEPTAGLDPEERVRFRNLLSDFAINRTVILSTHIVEDIAFACEKLAVLHSGKVIYDGRVKDLTEKAQGLVWEVNTERHFIADIRRKYKVVSYVTEGEKVRVRLISPEKPYENARIIEPTIEDAYLGLMGGVVN